MTKSERTTTSGVLRSGRLTVTTVLAVCLSFFIASAQDHASDTSSFGYKFENKRFDVSLIEIDLTPDGSGSLRFKKGESDDIIDRKVKLLAPTAARLRSLLDTTQFLTSTENYQDKKDFSHLGWHSIWQREGERERSVRFNYTTNLKIREISEIFMGVATQEIDLFGLETAMQYQPLDVPRQLEVIENDLRLERIAEPTALSKPLSDLQIDETMPLIARNQAKRIVDDIRKGKFKSPVKK
jgi:hypothetical protein